MAKLFKWLIVLLIPLFSLTLLSCGGDEENEPESSYIPDNSGGHDNDNGEDDDILDEILRNTTFYTTYSDFFFETEIRTKLTDKIKNKNISHTLIHCTKDNSETGVEMKAADPYYQIEISTYKSDGYLYSKFKFPGAVYCAAKASWAKENGESSEIYTQRFGRFMKYLKEYQILQEELYTGNVSAEKEREIRKRMKSLKELMDDVMYEALSDYYQVYFIRLNEQSVRLGEWFYE